MGINGWRRLIISSKAQLSVHGNAVTIHQDDSDVLISLAQLHTIMIENPAVMLSTAFLTRMAEENIAVIVCDSKYMPAVELVSLHNETTNRLETQRNWENTRKDHVWMQILHRKLQSEIDLLEKYHLQNRDQLLSLQSSIHSIEQCDVIESQAAKYYFHALYGPDFFRRTESITNSALNYGYSIILSSISRAIVVHGLHPAIGIHHSNKKNPFNLSCDLIEPFRSIVDEYVYQYPDRELDWSYKKEMIGITQKLITYTQKRMTVEQAIDCMVLDVISAMNNAEQQIGVLGYA